LRTHCPKFTLWKEREKETHIQIIHVLENALSLIRESRAFISALCQKKLNQQNPSALFNLVITTELSERKESRDQRASD
jgi:hypothetical protein